MQLQISDFVALVFINLIPIETGICKFLGICERLQLFSVVIYSKQKHYKIQTGLEARHIFYMKKILKLNT